MLKISGIDHINIEVNDLKKSIMFYMNLFGFEIRKKQPEENSVIIGNDEVKLCLYEVDGFRKYQKKRISPFWITRGKF